LLLLALFASANAVCKIAFRLDDVQDWFALETQIALLKSFKGSNIPLTIGVITANFGSDPRIFDFVKKLVVDTTMFEVASHGVVHEDFSTFTLPVQSEMMRKAKETLEELLPGIHPVVTFLAPYDNYNLETIQAMSNNGYQVMSGGTVLEKCPHSNLIPIYRFNYGASTSSANALNLPVPASTTFAQLRDALSRCNDRAVVMMHPYEFSMPDGSANVTQFKELESLKASAKSLGCEFSLLRNMIVP
jgi:peptidoglycan/xylan/chitin deacetylase (PgdA/CDA1 family)